MLLETLGAWGATRNGILKAVLLSSLVSRGAHLFNAINTSLVPVVYQTLPALILGIRYTSLYLATRSTWPAIRLHWMTNALVNTKIATPYPTTQKRQRYGSCGGLGSFLGFSSACIRSG